jgi:hypothetical protein
MSATGITNFATLSVTVAGLGLSLVPVCPGRLVPGLVVVRFSGQIGHAVGALAPSSTGRGRAFPARLVFPSAGEQG